MTLDSTAESVMTESDFDVEREIASALEALSEEEIEKTDDNEKLEEEDAEEDQDEVRNFLETASSTHYFICDLYSPDVFGSAPKNV